MPRLSTDGRAAMGIAGIQGSIDGFLIPDSRGPYWLDPIHVVFIDPSDVGIWLYNTHTKDRVLLSMNAANDLLAKGSTWAAWLAGFGMYTSTGLVITDAGLLDVGPDGAIGYVVNRNDNNSPTHVRELDGTDWLLSNAPIAELNLLGDERALWRSFAFNFHTHNIPEPVSLPGLKWHPHAVFIQNEWWISYLSQLTGLVLHPFNSTKGYLILPYSDHIFHPDMISLSDQVIRIAWSSTNGEGPNDIRLLDTNIVLQPRLELGNPIIIDPIIPINKPCYLAWFEFNRPPVIQPPGNATIQVRFDDHDSIKLFNGTKFSRFIELSDIGEIERISASESLPIVASCDKRVWPRWPLLKPSDWLSITAYCGAHELLHEFERAIRVVIESIPPQYNQIALGCQAFEQMPINGLTDNLAGLVPIYARLAHDYPRINFMWAFSDQDRLGGMNSFPEIRPFWTELMMGITGIPNSGGTTMLDWNKIHDYGVDRWKKLEVNRISWELDPEGVGKCRPFQQEIFVKICKELFCDQHVHLDFFWKNGKPNYNNPDDVAEKLKHIGEDIIADLSLDRYRDVVGAMGHPSAHWNALGELKVITSGDQEKCGPPPCESVPVPEPGEIKAIIYRYTNPARRSDLKGCVIEFEIDSDRPVVEIRIEDSGGDLPFVWTRTSGTKDGRYFRVFGVKVTIEGNHTLKLSGKDDAGRTAFTEVPLTVIP